MSNNKDTLFPAKSTCCTMRTLGFSVLYRGNLKQILGHRSDRVKTLPRIYKQVGSLEQELEFKYFGVEQESLFSITSTLGDPMFATLNTKAKIDVRVR